jgi:hypothetical protein
MNQAMMSSGKGATGVIVCKFEVFAKEAYVAAALPYFLDTRRLKGSKKTWQCGFTSTSNARDIDFFTFVPTPKIIKLRQPQQHHHV